MRDKAKTGKLFISYSHKDKKWMEELQTQLKVLQLQGNIDPWDDTRINAGEEWEAEIETAIEEAEAAVLLISADFLVSDFIMREEVPALLRKRAQGEMKIFPLILYECPWQEVEWLKGIQARPKNAKPLAELAKPKRKKALSDFAVEIKNILTAGNKSRPANGGGEIDLSKLPNTGNIFFGREKQLKALDKYWSDDSVHIVSLVAWGGVGKSALVNRWLNRMKKKSYRGAGNVYGWSFYSQGAAEGKQAAADLHEAKQIAQMGDMKLHLCDIHLETARLSRDEGKMTEAKEHYETAAKLIEETGYLRRKPEVELI